HEDVEQAVAVHVTERGPHVGLGLAHAVVGEAARHGLLLERAVALVDPQVIRFAVVGNKDVRPTVAVEVGAENAETRPRRPAEARLQRDVLEPDRAWGGAGGAAPIVIELGDLASERARPAVIKATVPARALLIRHKID